MDKIAVLKSLKEIGLVPVLRAESVDKALALAEAIAAGGVTVLEITMTVPGAIQVMRRLAEQRPPVLGRPCLVRSLVESAELQVERAGISELIEE